MASLAQEDVSFAELSTVIEGDTVLAGNVLRLVNSALYGRRGTISSVRHALSIMGLTKLRNYVLSLSVSKLWSRVATAPSWSMVRFNQHSAAAAVLADLIVQRVECSYSEGAFAAGLLHDIGRLMIAVSLPAEYEKIHALFCSTAMTLEECEREVLDITHAELGAGALARWGIPGPVQKAIAGHHGGPAATVGGPGVNLALVVHAANEMADHMGYSIFPIEVERAEPAAVIAARVGLTAGLDQVLETFETEFSSLRNSL
jgi:HD-like signal output (HDOD) protein